MIRSTIKTHNFFAQTTRAIQEAAREGVDAASREAAAVAEANAEIGSGGLELQVIAARPDGSEGYSGGIVSRRQSSTDGSTTPIAALFDKGTLGNRKGKLKRARKSTWTRAGHTVNRGVVAGKGIRAQRFFLKARIAGRKAMLERITRSLR